MSSMRLSRVICLLQDQINSINLSYKRMQPIMTTHCLNLCFGSIKYNSAFVKLVSVCHLSMHVCYSLSITRIMKRVFFKVYIWLTHTNDLHKITNF